MASGARLSPQQKLRQENTMAENEGGTSGLAWFLAGLGIGTLVGVLYAPKAGKETREDLVKGAREASDKAAELVEQGKQKATEYVEQGSMSSRASRRLPNWSKKASARPRNRSTKGASITIRGAPSGRSMWRRARAL
jgi:gas vesicle protein